MNYCYIIKSSTSGRLYIGQTNNLDDRLFRHNNNMNLATKNKGPWVLVHAFIFENRSDAVKLEKKLKAFKNPAKVLEYIQNRNVG